MRSRELFGFIYKRHDIYVRRMAGFPKPWTDDPILQKYRFCNVYRELDKVTIWIRENWREPAKDKPDVWFAMAVARFVNWPDTLSELKNPALTGWDPDDFVKKLEARKKRGEKVMGGAYMTHAESGYSSKAAYLAEKVLNPLWESRTHLRPVKKTPLWMWADALECEKDIGSFMAGQIVADTKHTARCVDAPDWKTFAVPGPGSRRGLNRVFGREKNTTFSPVDGCWEKMFYSLYDTIEPLVKRAQMPFLDAQDLQNCLCEFDKHERVRLGEGKPRARYNGERE